MDTEARFRAKITRRAGHEIWTGARDATGTGLVRIDGTLRTVQRAAWEFAHGPVPAGARVLSCEVERACVRLSHLQLHEPKVPANGSPDHAPPPTRRRRGTGSKRQVRPGVWELVVSDGPGRKGNLRRRSMRVHGSEADAAATLDALAETTIHPTRLGDLRVRELIDRFLAWADDATPTEQARLRHLADDVIAPAIGRTYAALLEPADLFELLETHRAAGASHDEIRDLHRLLAHTYRWARTNRWTRLNPVADVPLRDLLR